MTRSKRMCAFEVITNEQGTEAVKLLEKGTILVKRLPMMNARFEVLGVSAQRVVIRRIDGDRRHRVESFELESAYLRKHGYLLESEAGPHPLEVESKEDRILARQDG